MWNLSLLQIFISVAENASFTRAASEVYRSQSAVSMQIKKLEEIVGAPLFTRNSKEIELSAEGRVFLEYAHRILKLVDEGLSAVRVRGRGEAVRIGCIEDYAARLLPAILASFWKDHPDVQIEVRAGETGDLMQGLGTAFDLVIASYPEGRNDADVIGTDKLVWATSVLASPHDDNRIPVAFRVEALLDREWASSALDSVDRPWRCTYLASGIGTLETAVRAGLAVGVFKISTVPDGVRILTAEDGFPDLPSVDIALHKSIQSTSRSVIVELASTLSTEIGKAITQPGIH